MRVLCLLASVVLFLASAAQGYAATKFSKSGNRSWGTNNDWTTACGGTGNAGTPASGDDVVICAGSTMTVNTNTNAVASITINAGGVLRIGNNNTARTVTVTGDVTNNGSFIVTTGSNTTHSVLIGGNLLNNDTFDMATDANSLAQVTFNGNGSRTISGTGTLTRFYRLVVSLGTSAANILDYTADDFQFSASPAGCLLLANGGASIPSNANCVGGLPNTPTNPATGGTFKISRTGPALSISPFDNAPMANTPNCYLIGSAAGFWLNSAATTISVGDATATCNGAGAPLNISMNGSTFRVTAGAVNLVARQDQRLRLLNSANSTYWQEGGTVTLGGRLTSVNATDSGVIRMDGGTLTTGTIGNTDSTFGPFFLGSGAGSQFLMSGGTIAIRMPSTGGARAYDNRAPSATVTGGTLQIGDGSTSAGQTFDVASSSAPIWNFAVNSTNGPTARLQTAFTVRNDLTIGTGATLNANNQNITIGDGSATGIWTNNGSFSAGTGTVTFTGSGTSQAIAGSSTTAFYGLTVNKSSGTSLAISTSPTVSNLLTLTAGTVRTGSNKLTLGASAAVSRAGGLTPAAAATNHVVGNLEKTFPAGAASFVFPIGDGNSYTPIQVAFAAGASGGNLTATTPAAPPADHPDTTGGRSGINPASSVNRYWTLKNSTTAGTYNVTLHYLASDLDSAAPSSVGRGAGCATSAGVRNCNPWGRYGGTLSGSSIATSAGLKLVSGEPETDFVAGTATTPRFVRQKEFIYTREKY